MGSVFSKPSLPAPVSIIETAPIVQPQSNISVDISDDSKSDAEQVAKIVRKRKRPQTILTSFRGVLAPNNTLAPQRKSLLGE